MHKSETRALAWLAGATVHAIVADQAGGQGRLSHGQLQALVKMSKDNLLLADLPGKALLKRSSQSLERIGRMLEWLAPDMGCREIIDAVPLEDDRYLVAFGEAGAAVIDGAGKLLFHFPVPAQVIVQSASRQVALVLARRDGVWRISKLDLVNRSARDLGVLRLDVFSRSFDGSRWTIGRGDQLRVVDVDHGLETLWHVGDLPGRVVALENDDAHEYLWLLEAEGGAQVWTYRKADRALLGREPVVSKGHFEKSSLLFSSTRQPVEFFVVQDDREGPQLVLEHAGIGKRYSLPGLAPQALEEDRLELLLSGPWLVVSYPVAGNENRVHFIHRNSDRLCAALQWPGELRIRGEGVEWTLFDGQGRLCHIDLKEVRQRMVSVR